MILTNGRIYTMEPRPTPECFEQAVSEAIDECLAAGLTGIHEMGVELHAVASYRRLVERGRFPFRNYAAAAARSRSTWAHYREHGPETIGDGRVAVRALKLMADGALGSRGAALHDAYCDDPGNTGLVLIPADEITRLTLEAAARGFQVCVHAIGDRANTLTLDALEAALARTPYPGATVHLVRRFTAIGSGVAAWMPTRCIAASGRHSRNSESQKGETKHVS